MTIAEYAKLSSLPKNPAALEAYFARGACVRYGLPHVSARPTSSGRGLQYVLPPASATPTLSPLTGQDCRSAEALQAYSTIQWLLSSGILPPDLNAELYHALADVPGIIAKKNVKDISGQTGVEFILPESPRNENLATILSATTYQYLGQASWYGHPPYVWVKSGQEPGAYLEEVLLEVGPRLRSRRAPLNPPRRRRRRPVGTPWRAWLRRAPSASRRCSRR